MSSTRTEILTEVQFNQIVQISHIETRLKKNFQLIVDQLRRQGDNSTKKDGQVKQLRQTIKTLQQKLQQVTDNQQSLIQKQQATKQMGKDILKQVSDRDSKLKAEIMQLIDDKLAQDRRQSQSQNSTADQLKSEIDMLRSKLQLQNKNNEGRDDTIDNMLADIALMKELQARHNQAFLDEMEKLKNQNQEIVETVGAVGQHSQRDTNDKDFRQTITTLPSSASNDDLSQKLANLQRRVAQLSQHLKEKEKVIQTHTKQIWQINDKLFNVEKANDIDHIKMKEEIEALKRSLEAAGIKVLSVGEMGDGIQHIRPKSGKISGDDHERRLKEMQRKIEILLQSNDLLSKNLKGCQDEIETLVTHLNTSRNMTSILQNQTDRQGDSKQFGDSKNDLKRQLLLKISDQRRQYMTLLKDMMKNKQNGGHEEQDRMFEDAINELRYNVGKKADEENTKKAVVFLEKKINYIFNTFLNIGQEDARIAKKNWFCLSCDRKLNTFTGKIGDYIPNNGLKGSKLNSTISLEKHMNTQTQQQSPTPGMNQRYKSKTKLDLPSLGTTAAKR